MIYICTCISRHTNKSKLLSIFMKRKSFSTLLLCCLILLQDEIREKAKIFYYDTHIRDHPERYTAYSDLPTLASKKSSVSTITSVLLPNFFSKRSENNKCCCGQMQKIRIEVRWMQVFSLILNAICLQILNWQSALHVDIITPSVEKFTIFKQLICR